MKTSLSRLALLAAAVVAPSFVLGFNGIKVMPRVYDDFTTSSLTITNSNSIPGSVVFDDRNMVDDGIGGNWANRHDALLSTDGGLTAYVSSITAPITITAKLTLTAGANAPRKEAGLRINSPISGDALFIVNSDAGEIVAFGGGAPFYIFGKNSTGNGYTPGTQIMMGLKYTPGAPGTVEYMIDRGAGLETSGPLNWDNLEGGPVDYSVGVYAQVSPADANDFINADFQDINGVVPEPASLAALGIGLIALIRRRRS